MRWRGIHSQNQLSRLSGVPQSCIHRILTREDHYSPARNTVVRLAQALGTSASWLTDGVVPATSPGSGLQDAAANGIDGYCAEICARLAPQPDSTKRLILALVRELSDKPDTGATPAPRPAARKCA